MRSVYVCKGGGMTHESMEEREGWPAAMAAWEDWKGGGYSTYDAMLVETLSRD